MVSNIFAVCLQLYFRKRYLQYTEWFYHLAYCAAWCNKNVFALANWEKDKGASNSSRGDAKRDCKSADGGKEFTRRPGDHSASDCNGQQRSWEAAGRARGHQGL